MSHDGIFQTAIDTIRTLPIDAVEQARSGHPGTPMTLAPLVYTLWNRVMRFDPLDPIWPDRDRFVLSTGHASMLLWSVLHLTRRRAVNPDYGWLGQPSLALAHIRESNSALARPNQDQEAQKALARTLELADMKAQAI